MNRFIPKNHRLVTILCVLVLAGFFRPAKADLALFKFTGAGINGSVAWGSFTVADTALVPNYYANGNIYPSLSMTVSNIPGAGPGFVVFSLEEINSSSFTVDSNGIPSIQPLGGHSFGAPDQNHYDIGGGPEPGQGTLTYNGAFRDTLIWSSLTRVFPPAPPTLSSQATALDLTLLWPVSGDTFVLEATAGLTPPVTWSAVTNTVATTNDMFSVTLPFDGADDRFFRLRWTGP